MSMTLRFVDMVWRRKYDTSVCLHCFGAIYMTLRFVDIDNHGFGTMSMTLRFVDMVWRRKYDTSVCLHCFGAIYMTLRFVDIDNHGLAP